MKKDEFLQYVIDAYRPAENLIQMVPEDKLDWKPAPNFMTLGQLICHLSDSVGDALKKTVHDEWPKMENPEESLKHEMPSCSVAQSITRLEQDRTVLRQILSEISEVDFQDKIVTVPWGWNSKIEKMSLQFLEHFFHHKMQLFLYLKLLGFPVNTESLYFG